MTLKLLSTPEGVRKFWGWQIVFWALNIPPFTALFFILPTNTFVAFSLLYLGEISILALVFSAAATWQGAKVEQRQQDDANVQEVLDKLDEVNGQSL